MKTRIFLFCAVISTNLYSADFLWKMLSGSYNRSPLPQHLISFVESSLTDLEEVIDTHMHILGLQEDKTGCSVHPASFSPFSFEYIKTKVMLNTCGINALDHADAQASEKMTALIDSFPLPYTGLIFAFASSYDKDHKLNKEKTRLCLTDPFFVNTSDTSLV